MSDYIIQKFGGTSLGNANRMASVTDIIKSYHKQSKVIVVVSAISSYDKKQGTTAKLLCAKEEVKKRGAYAKVIDQIEEDHLQLVEDSSLDQKNKEALGSEIRQLLRHLKNFLSALETIQEVSNRSEDLILSHGEKLSVLILRTFLRASGLEAEEVDLVNIVDFETQEPDYHFFKLLKKKLYRRILECGSKVPVVTGFFGHVPGGILEGIGRGYTDLTAALISVSMKAKELQIWKEVDGIYSADPRKVNNARVLEKITPEEASELTYYGSEVIHPFTLEQVAKENIRVRIMNTFKPELPGTLIDCSKEQTSSISSRKPSAVTCKNGIEVVNIFSNRMLMAYGFMAKVFRVFENHRIIIDLLSTTEVNISLTIKENSLSKEVIRELEEYGEVTIRKRMSILSLVGIGMKHIPGMAGCMFETLAANNINIEMISQGASEINISCVINESDSLKAIEVIHEKMLT